ncbi:MAG: hypothetical protein R6U96_03255 [Promethearchaeia archaeon]
MPQTSRKQKRKINYTNAAKHLFLMGLLGTLALYQVLWIQSAQNISVSYDISEYNIDAPEIKSFDDYIESLFEYMQSYPINLTSAANYVYDENKTLIENIEEELGYNITEVQEIYDAYSSGTLTEVYVIPFLEQMWRYGRDRFIPESLLEPSYINITISGWASIYDISFFGKIHLQGRSVLFLENLNNVLTPVDDLILQITIRDLVIAIMDIAFEFFIDLTVQILEDTGDVLDSFLNYLNEFLNDFDISVTFNGEALIGLLRTDFGFLVDLKSIIDNLQLESVLS